MIGRPTQSNLNVKIYNVFTGSLLIDTNSDGTTTNKTDMQPWTLVLSFKPVEESKRINGVIET